ncbi:exopolysaccharide biosynthesis protein [Elioraea sp.]|uniref:exopolysaccharide biosynthesis protein n=1 Tax=Elioraea sp. TaxID=2185103 RepID=UPI003F710F26
MAEVARVPTSILLEGLMHEAPCGTVSLGWVVDRLGPRSFGLVLLLLGLLALLPGIAIAAGLLLAIPASQMLRGHAAPVFPQRLSARGLPTQRLVALIQRALPVLRAMERVMRPRFATPFQTTKRLVGALMLLLGALLLATPVPLSNIPYAVAIILVAVAYLEEDGIVLCIALGATSLAFAAGAAVIWMTLL